MLNTKAVIDAATTLYTPILKIVTHEGLRHCEPKLTLLHGGDIYADIIEIDGAVATMGDAMSMGYIVYE